MAYCIIQELVIFKLCLELLSYFNLNQIGNFMHSIVHPSLLNAVFSILGQSDPITSKRVDVPY